MSVFSVRKVTLSKLLGRRKTQSLQNQLCKDINRHLKINLATYYGEQRLLLLHDHILLIEKYIGIASSKL